MDIEALRSFIAFVDTGSFTRAAKQTFRTQGAISMQMKKLEEETGHALFIKEGRNLALTDQGQQLVSYARRIIALHDQALSEFQHSQQLPPLRIGCPDDYAESILPLLVELIAEHHSRLTLRIACDCSSKLRQQLDAGEIDVAILTRAPEKEEGYLLCHDKGVWVSGCDTTIINAQPLPLVLYEPDCKFHSTAIDGLEKMGRDYLLKCSTSSATAIKAMLKKGLGISAMASTSLSPGLSLLDSTQLPALPAVDIVLAVAPVAHPMFGTSMAAEISQLFLSKFSLSS